MLSKKPETIQPSEITDKSVYLKRREFIQAAAASGLWAAGLTGSLLGAANANAGTRLAGVRKSAYTVPDAQTPLKDITTYNNFYEFGTDKSSPAELAKSLRPRPWTVSVEGEVKNAKTYDIDELIKLNPLEDRIYRLRCVEGWSMVIPWVGFPLADLIRRAEPTGKAKYVEFVSLNDPSQMPGQRSPVLEWPYVEGLRLDEAMNPLALMAVGLYGEVLPNQNGAPIRLVVPWKYGFKSIKSVVKIRLVEKQPISAWMKANPNEYAFYSNVNPKVDHPRWSQAKERRIGEFFKRETLPFNGYANQVAQMYAGMDLKKYF